MIGMVAMMGAILRAPLAALVALMELTGNLNIILPGMIVVVTAEIATRGLVGDKSAFTAMLKVKLQRENAQRAREKQLLQEQQQAGIIEQVSETSEADDILHDKK